jgi:hypothetical protein
LGKLTWYGAGDADNVTDAGKVWGWGDQSGNQHGAMMPDGKRAYRFGPVIGHFGTWGQLVYRGAGDLGAGVAAATGLNGHMPANPAPDNNIWIQGHLINSDLGGRGSLASNLTPLCHNVNMGMKKFDNAVKRLVNADGAMTIRFNPHGIADCRVIYRVHATPPPSGTNPNPGAPHPFPNVPNGVVMSIGIVIGGVFKTEPELQWHLNNRPLLLADRWFSEGYYAGGGNALLNGDGATLQMLIGGIDLRTP